jgi:hypothetical protein
MLYCYSQMCEMNGWAFFRAVLEKMIISTFCSKLYKRPLEIFNSNFFPASSTKHKAYWTYIKYQQIIDCQHQTSRDHKHPQTRILPNSQLASHLSISTYHK